MEQLHQMQLTFAPEDDRLLFRVNTAGGRQRAEFRFWFTRRYVRILWMALMNMLEQRQPKEKFKDEIAHTQALVQEHRKALEHADFQTQYQESAVFPLGEVPILLSRVSLKANEAGEQILCLHPTNGQGLELGLNDQILHSFCKLLADSSKTAEWDLPLDFGRVEDLIARRGLN
jgi:hypothetical protein